jgi:hypothetical protein
MKLSKAAIVIRYLSYVSDITVAVERDPNNG